MAVKTTRILKNFLDEDNLNVEEFCTRFASWKLSLDEYSSYFFGKDSAYVKPTVGTDKYILRHVHIVPILDKIQLSKWNRLSKLKKRKTSDRVLIYVSDNKGNFLLIIILSEPNAHEVAEMKTQTHKELMEYFATVAEAFIFDGSILA
jgi:mRNA interferase YafO